MPARLLPVFLLICITACSGSLILNSDAAIKEEIIRAVRDYSSPDWETRRRALNRAAEYLDSDFSKNVILFLIKATDDTHPLVRAEALRELKKARAESAHEKIRFLAVNDTDTNVRVFALDALGEYRSPEDEEAFKKSFMDADWLIREAAIRGLLKIDDAAVQERNIELILKAINDPNISVQIETLNTLQYKDPRLYREISRLINNKNTKISLLKAALAAASGYRFDGVTRKRLIRLVTHSNKEVRLLAFRALKKEEQMNE